MQSAASAISSNLTEMSAMGAAQMASLLQVQAKTIAEQDERIAALTHQLDWFRRQIFGSKSERFAPEPDPSQLHLGEAFPVPAPTVEKTRAIPAHTRRVHQCQRRSDYRSIPAV